MLTQLVLRNFKAFGRRQIIPLAPITLIFGANSAGKSSILQALLLLKQTVNAPDGSSVLLTKGDLVDLGSFRELVFRNDVRRSVEIVPFFPPGRAAQRLWEFQSGDHVGLGLQFCFDRQNQSIWLKDVGFYLGAAVSTPAFRLIPTDVDGGTSGAVDEERRRMTQSVLLRLASITKTHPVWRDVYERNLANMRHGELHMLQRRAAKRNVDDKAGRVPPVNDDFIGALRRLSRYDPSSLVNDLRARAAGHLLMRRNFLPNEIVQSFDDEPSPTATLANEFLAARAVERTRSRTLRSLPLGSASLDLNRLALAIAREFRAQLDSVVYLGPVREYPERHYYYVFDGNAVREVGKSGRGLPHLLFKHRGLLDETNQVLREFEIGYSVYLSPIQAPRVYDVFALRLVDERTRTNTVSMLDVGFGISQILPVIVQSMLSQRSIILVEQPEIHLHPRLQAHLGSLFARCIRPPRHNQFIIETHSEHLILRVQRLLRERQLTPDDVSVLYVTKDRGGSFCHVLRLDDEGDFIDAWPEGFFEEDYRELFPTA